MNRSEVTPGVPRWKRLGIAHCSGASSRERPPLIGNNGVLTRADCILNSNVNHLGLTGNNVLEIPKYDAPGTRAFEVLNSVTPWDYVIRVMCCKMC